MAKIIVFGNQKGGVGKSTLTMLCAAAFASQGRAVFVADIDKQGSLSDAGRDAAYTCEKTTLAALLNRLPDLDKKNDVVFIDAAGKLDSDLPADQQEITRILLFADLLCIPVTPGNFSIAATLDYIKLAMLCRAARPPDRPLKIAVFINQAEPATRDHKELSAQLIELADLTNITAMTAYLPRYAVFRAAGANDSLLAPRGKDKAKNAFTSWFKELQKIIAE